MKLKNYFPFIILLIISVVFFFKTIFFFNIPFPGDLLVSEYSPFKYDKYLGYNPGSYPNKAQYFDVIQQLYPWKVFAVSELKAGRFPLWNPYNFSGMPLFANNQSSVLNPFNFLFFLLSPPVAWAVYIFLQPILASLFTYLYLRKIKLSNLGALFGAVAFSYSLFTSVFLEYGNFGYSILWLPFLLYLVESLFQNKKSSLQLLTPPVIAVISFSGHLQLFVGILGFAVIYIIFRYLFFAKKDTQTFILMFVYLVLGIGISSIQLFPTLELINNSARISHSLNNFKDNMLLQLNQLILLVSPDAYGNPVTRNYLLKDAYPGNAIYVGIITLIFSVFSIPIFKRNNYVKLFAVISGSLLILLTNNQLSNIFYSLNIPFISSSSPSNFMFLLSFSLATLAGFGIDSWKKKFSQKILFSIAAIVVFVSVLFFLHKALHLELLQKQLLIGLILLLISSITITVLSFLKKEKFIYLLLIILVGDLLYYFLKFNPFVPKELVYPENKVTDFIKNYDDTRAWGYSAAHIAPNVQTYYAIYSPEGYDPLYPKWYGEFIYSSKDGKLLSEFSETTRSDAIIPNGYGEKDFRENEYRLKVLDHLGVGLILNRKESATSDYTFDEKKFTKIYDADGWSAYKNLEALPHIYLVTSYDTYSSKHEFEEKFFKGQKLLLEKNPDILIKKDAAIGAAKIISYRPNTVAITTNSQSNSLLVLLDTYYPGWKAYIDGKESNILKANYTFRAIAVPGGKHTVIFKYQPSSFYWGTIITIISSVLAVSVWIFAKRKRL